MSRLLIVTGMSGAGKTIALKSLEDMGFYCVDNLPIPLVEKFAELVKDGNGEIQNAALGVDIRSGGDLLILRDIFDRWDAGGTTQYQVLFLDASDEILLKRYKETRRAHPLSRDGRVETGTARTTSSTAPGSSQKSSGASWLTSSCMTGSMRTSR